MSKVAKMHLVLIALDGKKEVINQAYEYNHCGHSYSSLGQKNKTT